MKELIKIEEKPIIPENWDYDESVQKVKTLIYKWKNLTRVLFNELSIAKQVLSSPGKRTNLVTKVTRLHTWGEYCEEAIDSNFRVVNRWLTHWQEREIIKLTMPKIEAKVIYADPPWPYKNTGFDESAKQHYNIGNI